MSSPEQQELTLLKNQVASLQEQVRDLRDFVRAIYTMIENDDGEYEAPADFVGGMEYGRTNT
ncbi:MAG: hypothetical protein PHT00_02120 [Candidatus Methanomethylophilus sp.]|nr:hypothetical protein [Methanomethylophilus sp.]MDD3232951.1 hypothetical protein [Methanomethylophilus sp.]MDD4221668.1 hypothetical protein [Methanomethylophilus sp.]MDD4668466.1 hypothetical protein [Methanomethylophilus sp.]